MDKNQDLVDFCDLVTDVRIKLGLVDATPDAVDVSLGVLREFRAHMSAKPKSKDNGKLVAVPAAHSSITEQPAS